jgi:hypothetical protein
LLDYIEIFAKSELTVGLCLLRWRDLTESETWKSNGPRGTDVVNVNHSKMTDSVMSPTPEPDGFYTVTCSVCDRANKKGRYLFTAKKRIWDG